MFMWPLRVFVWNFGLPGGQNFLSLCCPAAVLTAQARPHLASPVLPGRLAWRRHVVLAFSFFGQCGGMGPQDLVEGQLLVSRKDR